MTGRVVTFYSYKGGVGRSFAVANIAVILAQWGARVLVIDWDIEAPGLNHYFAQCRTPAQAGVLDFLEDCQRGQPQSWARYAQPISLPSLKGELQLMTAAADGDRDYMGLVQQLDWDELYLEHELGAKLEALRAEWVNRFDFVLLDSRTGITDFSGLTTAQLPDILAFMFTANGQSLNGCADVARRAMAARQDMPIDRPAILPLPIPARMEVRDEYDQATKWRLRFVETLGPFFNIWAPRGVEHLKLVDHLTIPYVARWTFGEELAALIESGGTSGVRTPSEAASYACETIAAALVQGLGRVELLTSSRDEYVHAARSLHLDARSSSRRPIVFCAYGQGDKDTSLSIMNAIRDRMNDAFDIVYDDFENRVSDTQEQVIDMIERSISCFVFFGSSAESNKWLYNQIEWMQRTGLRTDRRKPIFPIILPGGDEAFYSSRLADYRAIYWGGPHSDPADMPRIVESLNRLLT